MKRFKRLFRKRRIYRSGDMLFRIVKDKSMDKYCVEWCSKYDNGIWTRVASQANPNIFTVYRDMLYWMDFYKDRKLERV